MNLSDLLKNIFTNKKIILGAVGLIVVLEIIWAGWILTRPSASSITRSTTPSASDTNKGSSINLVASKTDVRVGENITVTASVFSTKSTDGVDLVLNFDPKLLQIEATSTASPVITSNLYSDYPLNQVDNTLGKVLVSGISSLDKGVIPNGALATLVFKAKAAGKASINVEFQKGKTNDSNITETKTSKDLLESVTNIELNIKQ